MRRKLFLAAASLCAGTASAFLTCSSWALLPIAAGFCAITLLVVLARIPKWALAFFACGIILFLRSYDFYENGGLSPWEGVDSDVTAQVKSVEMKEEDSYRITASVKRVNGQEASGDVLISYYGDLSEDMGAMSVYDLISLDISFRGAMEKPEEAGNPRVFDYSVYLRGMGIGWITSVSRIDIEGYGSRAAEYGGMIKSSLMKLREGFLNEIGEGGRPLARGILFGDTDTMEEDEYEKFRSNGTAHVLAVSGLHVGMIYGMFRMVKRRTGGGRLVDGLFVLFLLMYGFMTMWSVSVTRAVILILIKVTADVCRRRYDMLTALSLTAVILVIREPYSMFTAGFQMSFLAVISIIFLLSNAERGSGSVPGMAAGVQLPMMLYTAYSFNYFSPAGIIANIPVVFLISLFVPLGIGSFIFFAVCQVLLPSGGFLPEPADVVITGLSGAISRINNLFYMDGRLVFGVASMGAGVLVLVYGAIFYMSSEYRVINSLRGEKKKIMAFALAVVIAAGAAEISCASPFDRAEAVMTDVGQGDCLHLKWPENTDILIDGGGNAGYNVGEKILKPYLLKNGVWDIDLAAATHLHTDHYKGIEELVQCFNVNRELLWGEAGQVIQGPGGRKIEILWPLTAREISAEESGFEEDDENANSMIFKVYCQGFSILVTGDITEEGEKAILAYYKGTDALKADVLKVAHHGSKYSTCDDFLEAVNPKIAVIGVGKNNYGHPSDEVIEKLNEKDIIVYRTDLDGAIGMREEDGRIEVCTQKRRDTPLRFFPKI